MCTMCLVCGFELKNLGSECCCQNHSHPCCGDCKKIRTSSGSDGLDPVCSCKCCSTKYEQVTAGGDEFTPFVTPLISPANSLSSYKSCLSSWGDFSADMNLQSSSEYEDEETYGDSGKEHRNPEFHGHFEEQVTGSLLKSSDVQNSNMKENSDNLSFPRPMDQIDNKFDSSRARNGEDSNNDDISISQNRSSVDVQFIKSGENSEGMEIAIDGTSQSLMLLEGNTEPSQPSFSWLPPKPENVGDDIECSVANNDDDDEYNDGAKWDQPSSLSSFGQASGSGYCFKEERQKAMVAVMNGHFRELVTQLLILEGILIAKEAAGEGWLEIVSSLAWGAASLIKLGANEGRAMDPRCYVKVKCIASGYRSQSQVVRGVVFKKNAAHKHMPTMYKNPRLLLFRGILGHRASGLSSFDAMEEETNYQNSIIDMLETCHPNVVLVEKTVSRDVLESLSAKGITLVLDAKLPRLERLASCTGSRIISSADSLTNLALKQCDFFHIEKIIEEHGNADEGGKKLKKTLMFFEGCRKPFGCTILLKGADADELKRVKRAVHYAVFVAYHLILEISFLVDQRAIFSTTPSVGTGNDFLTERELPSSGSGFASTLGSDRVLLGEVASTRSSNILVPHGFQVKNVHEPGLPGVHTLSAGSSYEIDLNQRTLYNNTSSSNDLLQQETSQVCLEELGPHIFSGQLLPSLSASLKFSRESFTRVPATSCRSIFTYFGLKENEQDILNTDGLPIFPLLETLDSEIVEKVALNQEQANHNNCDGEKCEPKSGCCEVTTIQIQPVDSIKPVLDPQSILVLFSSRRALKEAVCDRRHLSRIKYYGNFDKSLGRFLRDDLLNQGHCCSTCGEPPEAHVYCYTHQNGKLTVYVKKFPEGFRLPGEAEGKLWTWSRCLKCERENHISKPPRRVVMSSAACGLSFGMFLEQIFSNRSLAGGLLSCGHSLHRDCLRFYGLGSIVTVFSYSSVDIYTACMPPPVLVFHDPNGQEWLRTEAKYVLEKGNLLFTEVANSLQKLSSQSVELTNPIKEFTEVEEMLRQEKSDFEMAVDKNGELGQAVHASLDLNRLVRELVLQSYVWDRRLHSLNLSTRVQNGTQDIKHKECLPWQREPGAARNIEERNILHNTNKNLGDGHDHTASIGNEAFISSGECNIVKLSNLEGVEMEIKLENTSLLDENVAKGIHVSQPLTEDMSVKSEKTQDFSRSSDETVFASLSDLSAGLTLTGNDQQENYLSLSHPLEGDQAIPDNSGHLQSPKTASGLVPKTKRMVDGLSLGWTSRNQNLLSDNLEVSESWVWLRFSESCKAYRRDLQKGYSPKFDFLNSYVPAFLSTAAQLIRQEGSRLCFPSGIDDSIVSVYEDEITSIVACALTLSKNQYKSMEISVEKVTQLKDGENEKLDGLPYWSPNGSLDPTEIPLERLISSEDLSTLGSEGSNTDNPLLYSGILHPEFSVGDGKTPGKGKYSVVCIYAEHFYALRKRCCPDELDYISSLSRCKKWDAQGGKSKVFFAKTLDDRFIIKQVKKTELESFLKFGPYYFNHISHSLRSGSQTCLAKILGIYQVVIRQTKNGKDLKIDLMVMENLLFGRKISRLYDLKGALHSRYTLDSKETGKVLLDKNFVEDMLLSPLFVGNKAKHLLQRAVWNDTAFLTSINVMDYSLLVGVDSQRHELVFGIIDYMRQYTWDKHLETWVKSSLVVPKNALPTVISPKEYKKRFRKFMSTYFLTVPDTWCPKSISGLQFSGSGNDSPQLNDSELTDDI